MDDFLNLVERFLTHIIIFLLARVLDKIQPMAGRLLTKWWRRQWSKIAAAYALAKSAPLWRRALALLMLIWIIGAYLAYALTGGIFDDPSPWAAWWFGSLSAFLWSYAAWLAARWVVRQTRRPLM